MNEDDSTISWDEQNQINEFSYMSVKKNEIKNSLFCISKNIIEAKDSFEELDLVFETELYCLIGNSYLLTNIEKIKEKKEKQLNELEEIKHEKERNLKVIEEKMKQIAGLLKARFGDSINLEE